MKWYSTLLYFCFGYTHKWMLTESSLFGVSFLTYLIIVPSSAATSAGPIGLCDIVVSSYSGYWNDKPCHSYQSWSTLMELIFNATCLRLLSDLELLFCLVWVSKSGNRPSEAWVASSLEQRMRMGSCAHGNSKWWLSSGHQKTFCPFIHIRVFVRSCVAERIGRSLFSVTPCTIFS